MYVFPYQVSLDPRVCIVGTNEKLSRKIFYKNLKYGMMEKEMGQI
jgi:hypothetical protein